MLKISYYFVIFSLISTSSMAFVCDIESVNNVEIKAQSISVSLTSKSSIRILFYDDANDIVDGFVSYYSEKFKVKRQDDIIEVLKDVNSSLFSYYYFKISRTTFSGVLVINDQSFQLNNCKFSPIF